jgi:hypothetical protein
LYGFRIASDASITCYRGFVTAMPRDTPHLRKYADAQRMTIGELPGLLSSFVCIQYR